MNDTKINRLKKNVNFRWVPTLTSDDVADRVVSAIQRKEKLAIIPRYLQLMLCVKWYANEIQFKIINNSKINISSRIKIQLIFLFSISKQDFPMGLCFRIFTSYCTGCRTSSCFRKRNASNSTSIDKGTFARKWKWR